MVLVVQDIKIADEILQIRIVIRMSEKLVLVKYITLHSKIFK